jgi:hypothetical protein
VRLNAVNTRKYAPVLHTNSHMCDSGERERYYSRRRVVFSCVFFVSVVGFVERSRAFVETFPYHESLGFMVLVVLGKFVGVLKIRFCLSLFF